MRKVLAIAFSAFAISASAADAVKATVHADQAGSKINKEIYGQFSEHLGSCIYGGLWVGEGSQIPNINGYRKDVRGPQGPSHSRYALARRLLCRRLSLDGRYRSKVTASIVAQQ